MMIRVTIAAAALALTGLAAPAEAQRRDDNAVQGPERIAMDRCVSQTLLKLKRAGQSYRAVPDALAADCDAQLRAVLAAAIRQGVAGPCTSVEGCIDQARTEAGRRASLEFQNQR